MGIAGVIIWLTGVLTCLTNHPDPPSILKNCGTNLGGRSNMTLSSWGCKNWAP